MIKLMRKSCAVFMALALIGLTTACGGNGGGGSSGGGAAVSGLSTPASVSVVNAN